MHLPLFYFLRWPWCVLSAARRDYSPNHWFAHLLIEQLDRVLFLRFWSIYYSVEYTDWLGQSLVSCEQGNIMFPDNTEPLLFTSWLQVNFIFTKKICTYSKSRWDFNFKCKTGNVTLNNPQLLIFELASNLSQVYFQSMNNDSSFFVSSVAWKKTGAVYQNYVGSSILSFYFITFIRKMGLYPKICL